MPSIATGQLTIIDYNDALTLTGFITSNRQKTQIYNPDNGTFVPDWSTSNLILTPSLFIAGSADDKIASIVTDSQKWYQVVGGTQTQITSGANNYTIGASSPWALTVAANKMTGSTAAIDYIFECQYLDASTNLTLTYKTSISLSKVVNGGGITDAIGWAPSGNVFKNGVGTLTAQCTLWRGSTEDTTNVSYTWYAQNGGSDDSTNPLIGAGWNKLTAGYSLGITGYATSTITIPASAITNVETFKCLITDTDAASPTYDQGYVDTITFIDQTDPIQVVVGSTGGDVFKNGVGSTTLTAKLFQSGQEIDAGGTTYTYTWTIYDKDGNASTFSGGAATKAGKTITVGGADVDVKATFQVDIT